MQTVLWISLFELYSEDLPLGCCWKIPTLLIWFESIVFWIPLLVCSITLPIGIYQGEQTFFPFSVASPMLYGEAIVQGVILCSKAQPCIRPWALPIQDDFECLVWFGQVVWDILTNKLYEAKMGVSYFYPWISFPMKCQVL